MSNPLATLCEQFLKERHYLKNVTPSTLISSCAKTQPTVLCGRTMVKPEQTTKPLAAPNGAAGDRRGASHDERVAQTLVRPFLMIVVDEFADSRPKMPFAERYDSRQALGSDRTNKSFGEGIQIRASAGQAHEFHATVLQHPPEGRRVERISVENQVVRVAEEAVVRISQVPSHLCHPQFVR